MGIDHEPPDADTVALELAADLLPDGDEARRRATPLLRELVEDWIGQAGDGLEPADVVEAGRENLEERLEDVGAQERFEAIRLVVLEHQVDRLTRRAFALACDTAERGTPEEATRQAAMEVDRELEALLRAVEGDDALPAGDRTRVEREIRAAMLDATYAADGPGGPLSFRLSDHLQSRD